MSARPQASAVLTPPGAWATVAADLPANRGDLTHAGPLSAVLWPRFIESEDHPILADRCNADNFRAWQRSKGHDRRAAGSVLSHGHLSGLVPSTGDEPPEAGGLIAQRLLRTWQAAQNGPHPTRHFQFLCATEPGGYGPTVCVWQTLPGGKS